MAITFSPSPINDQCFAFLFNAGVIQLEFLKTMVKFYHDYHLIKSAAQPMDFA